MTLMIEPVYCLQLLITCHLVVLIFLYIYYRLLECLLLVATLMVVLDLWHHPPCHNRYINSYLFIPCQTPLTPITIFVGITLVIDVAVT